MRIAYISTYDFAIPGGVKNHICHLANELNQQGNEVYIIAPSSQPEITSSIPNFIQISHFASAAKIKFIPPHLLFKPKAVLALKKILNSQDFDIIHVHEPLIPPLCISTLFHRKTPLFATFHTYYEKGQPLYRLFRPALNTLLNRLQGRIAVSTPAEKYIAHYFPYPYKIIPNGIDLEKFFTSTSTIVPLSRKDITLLYVGHAQFKRKGLFYLLEAYRLLKKELPQLRLVMAGTKWSGASQPKELDNLDLNDVLYLGTVSDEELISLYQSADIFCAPSTGNESFGIVLLEAMASGIPIITTKIEGYMSVVRDNYDALLVPPKDSLALAQAIKQLINNPELGQRLSKQAKISVQRYSWKTVAKEVMDYYEEKLNC